MDDGSRSRFDATALPRISLDEQFVQAHEVLFLSVHRLNHKSGLQIRFKSGGKRASSENLIDGSPKLIGSAARDEGYLIFQSEENEV